VRGRLFAQAALAERAEEGRAERAVLEVVDALEVREHALVLVVPGKDPVRAGDADAKREVRRQARLRVCGGNARRLLGRETFTKLAAGCCTAEALLRLNRSQFPDRVDCCSPCRDDDTRMQSNANAEPARASAAIISASSANRRCLINRLVRVEADVARDMVLQVIDRRQSRHRNR
jgi:hypothetical protein